MEYNKQQYAKASDKKILHKVKKHWVVLSTALLMALAGGATVLGGTTASANANVTNSDLGNNQVSNLKSKLNSNLKQVAQQKPQQSAAAQHHNLNLDNVDQQASALHDRIVANAASGNGLQNQNHGAARATSPAQTATVSEPEVGGTGPSAPNVPSTPQPQKLASTGGNHDASYEAFSDVPVTVVYTNSDGTIQETPSDSYKIGTKLFSIYGERGQQAKLCQSDQKSGNFVTYVPDHGYSLFDQTSDDPNNFTATLNSDGPEFPKLDSSAKFQIPKLTSDQINNELKNSNDKLLDSDIKGRLLYGTWAPKTVNSGVKWDSVNNRPLVVLKANHQQAGDIQVDYINESGRSVSVPGQNYTIPGTGRYGDSLDVWNTNRGGAPIPYNNGKSDFSQGSDYVLDSDATLNRYTFGDNEQIVTVPLEGKKFASDRPNADQNEGKALNYLTVNVYATSKDSQGHTRYMKADGSYSDNKVAYKQLKKYIGGQIGKTTYVDPHDDWLTSQLSDLQPDPSQEPVGIYFKGDGHGHGEMTSEDPNFNSTQQSIDLNYDVGQYSGKAAGIKVEYLDSQNENHVVASDTIKGMSDGSPAKSGKNGHPATPEFNYYGKTIDVTSPTNYYSYYRKPDGKKITTQIASGFPVPAGYTLAPNQFTRYTFGSDSDNGGNPQVVKLLVNGHQVVTNYNNSSDGNYPLTITLKKHYLTSEDGSPVKDGDQDKVSDVKITPQLIGQVGHSIGVNPTAFLKDIPVSGSYVQPVDGNTEYQLRFDGNQNANHLSLVNYSGKNASIHYTPLSRKSPAMNNMTIDYNVFKIPAALHRINIHYVAVNSDGTDNLKGSDIQSNNKMYERDADGNVVYEKDENGHDKLDEHGHKIPIMLPTSTTEVSDRGTNGAQFGVKNKQGNYTGDEYYRENVPYGYQFDKVLSVNGQNVSGKNSTKGITNFTNSDQNEVIEVLPISHGMTIHYIDQSGNHVYSDYEPGVRTASDQPDATPQDMPNAEAPGHSSRYGTSVQAYAGNQNPDLPSDPIVPASNDSITTPNGHTINGYHVSVESSVYRFGVPHKDYYVMVAGNNENQEADTVNVNLHKVNPNGVITSTSTVPDYVSGAAGDSYRINASDFVPNGYQVAPKYPSTVSGTILSNGVSKRTVDFYYSQAADQNYQDLKDVDVIFMDAGKQVGSNVIKPASGDVEFKPFDVTQRSGFAVPSYYHLAPNQNGTTSFNRNHDNTVILQTYYNTNPGDKDDQGYGNFAVVQNLYHGSVNPNNFVKSNLVQVPEAGTNGSQFTIDPNHFQINGYQLAPNQKSITGSVVGSDIAPGSASFNYVTTQSSDSTQSAPAHPSDDDPSSVVGPVTPTQAEPIFVQYYDSKDNSHPIGNDVRVNGYMGQNFSDITNSAHLPAHDMLLEGQKLNYTIGDQAQQVDLHVEQANNKAKPFTLHLITESPDGNTKLNSQTRSVMINGINSNNSSDQSTVLTPSDYNPDTTIYGDHKTLYGYGNDSKAASNRDLIVMNDNGTLKINEGQVKTLVNGKQIVQTNWVPASDGTFTYLAKQSTSDANVQPITVNFINQNDGRAVGSHTFSNGYAGQSIDVTAGQIPSGYNLTNSKANKDYTFGRQAQTVNLLVNGTATNGNVAADYKFINRDGTANKGPVPISINGAPGYSKLITPQEVLSGAATQGVSDTSDYEPLSPTVDPSDAPQRVVVGNNGIVTPNSVLFTYVQKLSASKDKNAAGILTIHYVNRNGQDVDRTPAIISNHHVGDIVSDVTQLKGVPHGYELDPNYPDQNFKYTFTKNSGAVYLHVINKAKPVTSQLTIRRVMTALDGNQTSDQITPSVQGHPGSDLQVTPGEYVPNGYHITPGDVDARVHVNIDGSITPQHLTYYYNQVENSDAAPISISYLNQDNQEVGRNSDGQIGSYVISGINHNGETINVTNPNAGQNNGIAGEKVPSDYTLVPGQNENYNFDQNPHNVVLRVVGTNVTSDTNDNLLTIHEHENYDGHHSVVTVHKYIHGNVGTVQTISPSQFAPKGYYATVSDEDKQLSLLPNTNGKSIDKKSGRQLTINGDPGNVIDWNYGPNNIKAAPLTLRYVNQAGAFVGTPDVIPGFVGQQISDLTNSDDGGESVPSGYQIVSGQKTTNYALTGQPQTVTLKVQGQHQAGQKLTVNEVLKDSDGYTQFRQVTYQVPTANNQTGDTVKITPTSTFDGQALNKDKTNSLDPVGYDVDSRDHDIDMLINSDGSLSEETTSGLKQMPNSITYWYNAHVVKGAPITVTYVNQDNHQVGKSYTLNGNVGDHAYETTIDGQQNGNSTVPYGYNLANGKHTTDYQTTFSKDPQNVIVPIQGQAKTATFTVYVQKKSMQGNKQGDPQPVPVTVKGAVGSDIHLTPYYRDGNGPLAPHGYHADASDHDVDVTINGDGSLSPVNSVEYNYVQSYVPNSVGQINIHYVTLDSNQQFPTDPSQLGSDNKVDEVSDRGMSGDSFNIAPYEDDVPDEISNAYHISGKYYYSYKGSTTPMEVNTPLHYKKDQQDIYIVINPNDPDDDDY